jgi:hypothetical protein
MKEVAKRGKPGADASKEEKKKAKQPTTYTNQSCISANTRETLFILIRASL